MRQSGQNAQYIKSFSAVTLSTLTEIPRLDYNHQSRELRKIQMFWAILHKAGFPSDEKDLMNLGARGRGIFNPKFNKDLRTEIWKGSQPEEPIDLPSLLKELETLADFMEKQPTHKVLESESSGSDLFDANAKALLNFLKTTSGRGGAIILRPYIQYHDPHAGDIVQDIIKNLEEGQTVILDLGSATESVRRYFSDLLSKAIFSHQEKKFTSNKLGDHFVQLYFEEAHNLFPRDASKHTDVYSRFAKEGAKFHIGMVYSTQSPSTISQELLAQTENFFVGHLSSQDETKALAKVQVQFAGLEEEIMRSRTIGYMRMLTFSHRFVIPVQAFLFGATSPKDVTI